MYNEYPDLIYEGLISDSFYTDIVEEGIGESIKNGFSKLKDIAKKAFDKIIEKLREFVGNVKKFISKIISKFKKKDDTEDKKSEDTEPENTTDSGDSGYNRNARNQRKRKLSGRYNQSSSDSDAEGEEIQDNSEDTEPENTTDSGDSGYNRNARNQRKRKLNGSYSNNHKKVKVVCKYNINFDKTKDIVLSFYYIFADLSITFLHIITLMEKIEKNEKDHDDQVYIKKAQSSDIDEVVDDIKDDIKNYQYLFEKTDEEILSELILNYGSDNVYEEEMEKSKAKEYCLKYQDTLLAIKKNTDDTIRVLEKSRDRSVKVFEIIDKKLKHSQLNKSDFSKEEKSKLKSYKIAGNKARVQYQKVIRFSSLFVRLQSILVSNIASLKVVEA